MATAITMTQIQDGIKVSGVSSIVHPYFSAGRRLNIFNMDGSTYMTAPYLPNTNEQEFWLWKFKSKKVGFVQYQKLGTGAGNNEEIRFAFPQINCLVPAVVKYGKYPALLAMERRLFPFMQS